MIEAPPALEPDAQALLCAAGRLGRFWQDTGTGAEGWDDATFRMLGVDPAQGVPSGGLFGRLHPQDAKRVREAWLDLARPTASTAPPGTLRCRVLRHDGAVRHLQLLDATPVTDQAVSPLRWTLVIDDTDAVDAYRAQWEDESVIGRRLAANRILVAAGAMALSKDRSTEATGHAAGFGLVLDTLGRRSYGHSVVRRANQEHGIIDLDPTIAASSFKVGDKLRIAPNHACLTAAAHDRYFVVDGDETVVEIWPRVNGW